MVNAYFFILYLDIFSFVGKYPQSLPRAKVAGVVSLKHQQRWKFVAKYLNKQGVGFPP